MGQRSLWTQKVRVALPSGPVPTCQLHPPTLATMPPFISPAPRQGWCPSLVSHLDGWPLRPGPHPVPPSEALSSQVQQTCFGTSLVALSQEGERRVWGRDPWSLGSLCRRRVTTCVLVTFKHLTKTLVMTGASTLLLYTGDISWTFNAAYDIHFHLISPGEEGRRAQPPAVCTGVLPAPCECVHAAGISQQVALCSQRLYFLGADEVLSSDLDPRFVD